VNEFRPLDYLRTVRAANLRGQDKMVLVWLMSYADETGKAFPSLDTLAEVSGFSRATVCRSVQSLSNTGWLSIHRRGRTMNNSYQLVTSQPETSPTETSHGATSLSATSPTETSDVSVGDECSLSVRRVTSQPETRSAYLSAHVSANGTDHQDFTLTRDAPPSSKRSKPKRRKPKHSEEEIAAKNSVVEAFVARYQAVRGCKPRTIDKGDHDAAFRLSRKYGPEVQTIFDRAFESGWLVNNNCTLKYIASKADSFVGKPVELRPNRMVQPAPAVSSWKAGDGQ
jgi:biotin operon repressor